MGSVASKVGFAGEFFRSVGAYMIFGWSDDAYLGDSETSASVPAGDTTITFLTNESLVTALSFKVFEGVILQKISDDSLAKIVRQLEYFYRATQEEEKEKESSSSSSDNNNCSSNNTEFMIQLAELLVDQSTWYLPLVANGEDTAAPSEHQQHITSKSKVPKVRFGKTELQMPIVTCGGMRLQNSWIPDTVPLLAPNRDYVLQSPPQENIKNCIRYCLSLGINHFETARMYGTSEYQITEALYQLMQEGVISREDIIFQTKLISGRTIDFSKSWDATWANVGAKLGFIDLLGVHAVADNDEKLSETMAFLKERQREGKIKHIGFSTHASSEQIMDLINTEQFDYINIHEHYFGSYHGSGTPDTLGGQGNLACVQRALELDMGIFLISPVDKGGKLYRPSRDVVSLVGPELTPIGFALLYGWKTNGFHTASIGVARPSDLDEVVQAARLMALGTAEEPLEKATKRLQNKAVETLGAEWMEQGLVNLPSFLDESTNGIAIGHILWLYNLLVCYGMYEFCHDRYQSLIGTAWNEKKSFKENTDAWSRGNMGRSYDETVDLTKALEKHYNSSLALERIQQTHEWLKDTSPKSPEELEQLGWKKAYNLTVWEEMPGEMDSRGVQRVLLQITTGGRLGVTETGPGCSIRKEAAAFRNALSPKK